MTPHMMRVPHDPTGEPQRIDQTVLGQKGNCHSACLAMLLGLRLDDVPNFNDAADYHGALHSFLARFGYTILTFPISAVELRAFQKGYAIVGGTSPRGYNHAVLYRDGQLWHDPHPERGGVEVAAMATTPYDVPWNVIRPGRDDDRGV